jgi:UDP-N-acetylmuramyl pentapeptide phosphotransferase/UDP-N-acetylglucosamine-1-phosphate transferase
LSSLVVPWVYGLFGNSPKEVVVDSTQRSKTSPGKTVGGVLLILFALVGGFGNLGRNPASNLGTITVMIILVIMGLGLTGILDRLRRNKQ